MAPTKDQIEMQEALARALQANKAEREGRIESLTESILGGAAGDIGDQHGENLTPDDLTAAGVARWVAARIVEAGLDEEIEHAIEMRGDAADQDGQDAAGPEWHVTQRVVSHKTIAVRATNEEEAILALMEGEGRVVNEEEEDSELVASGPAE